MSTQIEMTRTHCVGRFLMELPGGFRQRYGTAGGAGDVTFYFGRDENFKTVEASVLGEGVGQESFHTAVTSRVHALAEQSNYAVEGSMLVAERKLTHGAVMLRYYASQDVADSYVHELHGLVDDVHVMLKSTSFEGDSTGTEGRLTELLAAVSRVRVPERAGSGFCLGPVVIAAESDYEEASIRFLSAVRGRGPIKFEVGFDTFPQAPDEPSLVERGEANLTGLGVTPKALRKGGVQVAGMAADQWLGRFDEGGERQHGFYAETRGLAPTKTQPKLRLELLTGDQSSSGEYIGAPLDDDEAIRLWDLIVATLRPRPDA